MVGIEPTSRRVIFILFMHSRFHVSRDASKSAKWRRAESCLFSARAARRRLLPTLDGLAPRIRYRASRTRWLKRIYATTVASVGTRNAFTTAFFTRLSKFALTGVCWIIEEADNLGMHMRDNGIHLSSPVIPKNVRTTKRFAYETTKYEIAITFFSYFVISYDVRSSHVYSSPR